MALTRVVAAGIATGGSYEFTTLNTSGIVTAGTVQVGSATTIHTTGIDLGSGTINSHNINSTGVITATSFVGSGANLTGVSGFASALANSGPLNNVFKTSKTLEVTAGIHTVNSDAASDNLAFMRESIIHVAAGATFHIGSGTTLRTNILNLF